MEFIMDQSGKCASKHCLKSFSLRGNKRFCSTKCRNNFHNSLAAEQLNAFNGELKKVKKAEKTLKKIYLRMKELGKEFISEESLELFDIPLNAQLHSEVNTKTSLSIIWFGKYGIDPRDSRACQYKIHNRNN